MQIINRAKVKHINRVTQQKKVVEVSGVVSDASGPIIGASIIIKGVNTGVITNLDGEFTLKVPIGATLIVSYSRI